MHAALKRLHSPDIEKLETWRPSSADFGFLLQAMIGPRGADGAESFDILICTPGWFAEKMRGDTIRSGIHTLFMNTYDYPALVRYIERYIDKCESDTWAAAAKKLSFLGRWEFDTY